MISRVLPTLVGSVGPITTTKDKFTTTPGKFTTTCAEDLA